MCRLARPADVSALAWIVHLVFGLCALRVGARWRLAAPQQGGTIVAEACNAPLELV